MEAYLDGNETALYEAIMDSAEELGLTYDQLIKIVGVILLTAQVEEPMPLQ